MKDTGKYATELLEKKFAQNIMAALLTLLKMT